MKDINNNAAYEVVQVPNSARYWFRREYCDLKHGRTRHILVTIEPNDQSWSLLLEDKGTKQSWKLSFIKINSNEKQVFERYIRTREGVKEEIFNLSYLPNWVIEEIAQVSLEMEEKSLDPEAIEFTKSLVKQARDEKTEAQQTLTATVKELSIGGLHHIMTQTRGDDRGSFREVARFPEIELLTGYDFVGKQVNHSMSTYGILRGLHVEPWAKLVTVVSGLCVSVLLDCRKNSKTFGKMETVFLGFGTTPNGEVINGGALFIEPGIANSVLVLSDKLDYNYVVDDLWRPETALYAVNPMDPELGIDWGKYVPLDKIIRSDRDTNSPTFAEFTKTISK